MSRHITFNRLEWIIFDHRYSLLDDCILECVQTSVADNPDNFCGWPKNWKGAITFNPLFYNRVTKKTSDYIPVTEKWNRNHVVRVDVSNINDIDRFILEDVVDGSTWFNEFFDYKEDYKHWKETGETGYYYDPKVHGEYGTPSEQLKAARSIEGKLKSLGVVVRFPK